MKKLLIISILVIPVLLVNTNSARAEGITDRLKGKILLQVESRGQAWYVNPNDSKRYYLKDGDNAFNMLRDLGTGITNTNLAKIPVGLETRFQEIDADNDNLPDKLEEVLGTDKFDADTDNDGYLDGEEVVNSYDPLSSSSSKLIYNQDLIVKNKGKIFLQVEDRGQAWYVNPNDSKRYYLKDGEAAYKIMSYLGLGITENDLDEITIGSDFLTYANKKYGFYFDYPYNYDVKEYGVKDSNFVVGLFSSNLGIDISFQVYQSDDINTYSGQLFISPDGTPFIVSATNGMDEQVMLASFRFDPDWQYYHSPTYELSFKYPVGWYANKFDYGNGLVGIGLRPETVHPESVWGIFIYNSSEKEVEEMIASFGEQFEDRVESREDIVINGVPAVRVLVTTSKLENWYSEHVIIEREGKLYNLTNGAIKNDDFVTFYNSLEFE